MSLPLVYNIAYVTNFPKFASYLVHQQYKGGKEISSDCLSTRNKSSKRTNQRLQLFLLNPKPSIGWETPAKATPVHSLGHAESQFLMELPDCLDTSVEKISH